MASKAISQIKLTDTLTISECIDGFWLYDLLQSCNISMKAKTERDALVEGLKYYQSRYNKLENEYRVLNNNVQKFISSVSDNE